MRARKSTFARAFWMTTVILFLLACGKAQDTAKLAAISYELERPATNNGQNAIILDYPDDANYYIRITGTNLKSSMPLGVLQKAQKRIEISSDEIGSHSVEIVIALADQTEIIKDELKWAFDHELPPPPIVSFQTPASRDGNAVLLVSASRGPSVDEIWVGGDVLAPQWYTIPNSGKVPIVLSKGDGKKSLSIKLRNIAGNESVSQDMTIVRKSVGPDNCKAQPISTMINSSKLKLQLSATNDGPLSFRVLGDVKRITGFKTFEGKYEAEIELSREAGEKNIVVYMRDDAENYCPQMPLTVIVDPNYRTQKITLDRLWTDNPNIIAMLSVDAFEDHKIEMFISGGVEPSASTFQWVPFNPLVALELTPMDGNRFVTVQIRDNGKLREPESVGIFLKPYIKLGGAGSTRPILLSRMLGTESITITGCGESYTNVPYADDLVCTVGSDPVEARYHLNDGTDVVRFVNP